MFNRLPLIWLLCVVLSLFPNLAVAQTSGLPEGAELAATLDPSQMMLKAPPLLKAGRGDEAVFWFYAGQLRWRTRLNADPEQDPSGEPALFSALFETIGPDVNVWAFGDIPQLQRTIASVLEWDRRYPDPSLPKAASETIRAGLENLSLQVGREADQIRRERTAKGLPNR